MAKKIEIERLHIRVKGASDRSARSLAVGVGEGIMRHLSKQQESLPETGTLHINEVRAAKVATRADAPRSSLQTAIGRSVGQALVNSLAQTRGKRIP